MSGGLSVILTWALDQHSRRLPFWAHSWRLHELLLIVELCNTIGRSPLLLKLQKSRRAASLMIESGMSLRDGRNGYPAPMANQYRPRPPALPVTKTGRCDMQITHRSTLRAASLFLASHHSASISASRGVTLRSGGQPYPETFHSGCGCLNVGSSGITNGPKRGCLNQCQA